MICCIYALVFEANATHGCDVMHLAVLFGGNEVCTDNRDRSGCENCEINISI